MQPSTQIAWSLERDENLSGCVRCGACCVALLAKVPTLAAERRRAVHPHLTQRAL